MAIVGFILASALFFGFLYLLGGTFLVWLSMGLGALISMFSFFFGDGALNLVYLLVFGLLFVWLTPSALAPDGL